MLGRTKEKRSVADREGQASRSAGEVLVGQGKLGAEQLQAAIEARKSGGSIREALVSRALVSEEDAARALAEASGFEY